jgi:hypothetical protein
MLPIHEWDVIEWGLAISTLVSVVVFIGSLFQRTDTPNITYYGNQDKLVRSVDGCTQVTYKGR